MNIQRSYKGETGGALYLVPTPIGNLQDMTYRAVDILKTSDLIAAEDTRHTKKLCHAFEIDTPLISYHEHNKRERETELVEKIKSGQIIALVSDAGMPAISDPGADLASRCIKENLSVIPLPGANAALCALITSGLSTEAFTFLGFLNRKKKEKDVILEQWKLTKSSLIIYEAPHRIKETLQSINDVLGDRNIALCRELTKQFETIMRGRTMEILEDIQQSGIKGECVLVIEGASEEEVSDATEPQWWENLSTKAHVDVYIDQGESSKDAIKKTAKDRGVKKRDVYQVYHVDEQQ
ncbi:16S rRNA (cytidine(1402)-2'-O)-methyltransferase [Bacillus shivajii]|uniref:16S rRNA (cytidine(1402)-2'-O)-methyltransferase n=1 Tax=Bacillus shivajii TaxID=1983719 RepID=UPI001CFBF7E0|nr:16S rRNA (cytidine(1402)-2'-O)-methyltransferase [Bacillus shivajii]UCZ53296.1 16S rRNA (cytidine(1402)-2'-O)-methyltransferase [Bacillus shivajii]